MIQLHGENPTAALRHARHHAQAFVPLVLEITSGLLFSDLARDEKVHTLWQARSGPGSYTLYTADEGPVFSFKYSHASIATDPVIEVRDAYRMGNVVFLIRTIQDAWRFIDFVEDAVAKHAARGLAVAA
jgi:hypothetical protein